MNFAIRQDFGLKFLANSKPVMTRPRLQNSALRPRTNTIGIMSKKMMCVDVIQVILYSVPCNVLHWTDNNNFVIKQNANVVNN